MILSYNFEGSNKKLKAPSKLDEFKQKVNITLLKFFRYTPFSGFSILFYLPLAQLFYF